MRHAESHLQGRRPVNEDLRQTVGMQPQYRLGEPVSLRYALENVGAADYALLIWNTPLEGEVFAFADVRLGDRVVPYDGRHVKRGDPKPGSYRTLAAGGGVTGTAHLFPPFALDH